jgi:hypothetical protein
MSQRRSQIVVRGRATLAWTVVFFVAGQAALAAYLHLHHPEYMDPDHNERLHRLQARQSETAGRPLVVVLGSSRVANGLRPDKIVREGPTGPIVFNFGSLGCGPVRQWLTLRRVLASGIKPDLVVVEAWPLFWPQTGFFGEEPWLLVTDVYASDLSIFGMLYDKRWEAFAKLCQETLTPAVHYRAHLVQARAPWLLPREGSVDLTIGHVGHVGLDDYGWLPGKTGPGVSAGPHLEYDHGIAQFILDRFQVDKRTKTAIQGLLEDCTAHGIRVALVHLPESSPLRSWYPPTARAAVLDYLGCLEHRHGVPVFDMRESMPDATFADYCHLTPDGAEAFTKRFDHEVLGPLLGNTYSGHR